MAAAHGRWPGSRAPPCSSSSSKGRRPVRLRQIRRLRSTLPWESRRATQKGRAGRSTRHRPNWISSFWPRPPPSDFRSLQRKFQPSSVVVFILRNIATFGQNGSSGKPPQSGLAWALRTCSGRAHRAAVRIANGLNPSCTVARWPRRRERAGRSSCPARAMSVPDQASSCAACGGWVSALTRPATLPNSWKASVSTTAPTGFMTNYSRSHNLLDIE